MLVRPAAVAMLWSFCAGDPYVTSNRHGVVNPEVENEKVPLAALVVDAVPETHLAVTMPPLIAAPTAAVPVMGAVTGAVATAGTDGSLEPPPPQAAKTALKAPVAMNFFIFLFSLKVPVK